MTVRRAPGILVAALLALAVAWPGTPPGMCVAPSDDGYGTLERTDSLVTPVAAPFVLPFVVALTPPLAVAACAEPSSPAPPPRPETSRPLGPRAPPSA
jgi:hypothetical protein